MICTHEDDFTRSNFLSESRWIVKLGDGTNVIQDDYREGMEPYSAWLRLKKYLSENRNQYIEDIELQFRSHTERPFEIKKAEGYFFRKSCGAFLNSNSQYNFFVIGILIGEKAHTQIWNIPSLLFVENEIRDMYDKEKVGESLILNNL